MFPRLCCWFFPPEVFAAVTQVSMSGIAGIKFKVNVYIFFNCCTQFQRNEFASACIFKHHNEGIIKPLLLNEFNSVIDANCVFDCWPSDCSRNQRNRSKITQ